MPSVAEDLGGGVREFVQEDNELTLVLAEARCRRV
jgi:hypothetical protein